MLSERMREAVDATAAGCLADAMRENPAWVDADPRLVAEVFTAGMAAGIRALAAALEVPRA